MIPLPDARAWKGAEKRYLTHDEKQAILSGQPFEILDAQLDHGQELDVALLVRFIDSPTETIWTRHASPSRVRLVHAVQTAVARGETIGPVCCTPLPASKPGREAFPLVVNFRPPAEVPAEVHGGGDAPYPAAVAR
jgi:hypothetical protein